MHFLSILLLITYLITPIVSFKDLSNHSRFPKGRILDGTKTELNAASKSFDPKKMNDIWLFKKNKEENLNKIKEVLSEMEVGLDLLKEEARSKVGGMKELLDSNLNKGNVFQVKLNALF